MALTGAELVFASTLEFAGLLGASDSYVRRLKRTGKLVLDETGRIVVAASMVKLGRVLDPGRGGDRTGKTEASRSAAVIADVGTDTGDLSYSQASARDKLASARQRELDLAERAGALVAAADVEHRIANLVRAAIDQLASSRRRLAPALAYETDARAIERLLEDRDREFCTKVAGLATMAATARLEEAA